MTQGRKRSIWKDVPSYEGLYQVSDMGEVRSLDRIVTGVTPKNINTRRILNLSGRVLKPQRVNSCGHLKVSLSKDGGVVQWLIHVLVWKAFEGYHDVINHLKVIEMRLLRTEGTKLRVLAERFNVSEACCSNVCNRNSWRHVV